MSGVHASQSDGTPIGSPTVEAGYNLNSTDSEHLALIVANGASADLSSGSSSYLITSFLSGALVDGSNLNVSNYGSGRLYNHFTTNLSVENSGSVNLNNTGSSNLTWRNRFCI